MMITAARKLTALNLKSTIMLNKLLSCLQSRKCRKVIVKVHIVVVDRFYVL